MRVQQWLMAAALAVIPAVAAAQVTTGTATGTTTTTTTQPVTTTFDDVDAGGWLASAYVGSDFGRDADSASVDFGGALGYTNGWIGGEFLAGFSPNFTLVNDPLNDRPQINSYMLNVIASAPVGYDGQWLPYVSGGFGALTLRSDALEADEDALDETFDPHASRMGGNIGFGIMGFSGGVGLRTDVRYFRGFRNDELADPLQSTGSTPQSQMGNAILSGLDFWRANIGLAFRW